MIDELAQFYRRCALPARVWLSLRGRPRPRVSIMCVAIGAEAARIGRLQIADVHDVTAAAACEFPFFSHPGNGLLLARWGETSYLVRSSKTSYQVRSGETSYLVGSGSARRPCLAPVLQAAARAPPRAREREGRRGRAVCSKDVARGAACGAELEGVLGSQLAERQQGRVEHGLHGRGWHLPVPLSGLRLTLQK